MIKHNTWKSNTRLHKSIIISILVIIALSFNLYYIPIVKSDLPGPYFVRGYIKYYNNSSIPSGRIVTLTNNNNSNKITTTTLAGGAYQADVGKDSGMDCSNGNKIIVNCSSAGQVGENTTNINTGMTFRWCNLTGPKRLTNEILSVNVTPWTWNAGNLTEGTVGNSNHTKDTYFNLTNKGNIKINVYVHGHNITWGAWSNKWYLNATAGVNGYTLRYNLSGGGLTSISITNSTFKSSLQFKSNYFTYTYWQRFGLNITMPTSTTYSDMSALNTTISFWAIKA
jgi:hypothetical protein